MFNLEKKFVLERLSLERRRNGYCETMMGLSMGISDEIEVATIVIDQTIKSGYREWCDGGKGICQKEWNVQSFSFAF